MRRFQLGLATVALPILAMTLFLTGCKDDKKDSSTKDTGKQTTGPAGEVKVLKSKTGVLRGKIKLEASPPVAAEDTKILELISKNDNKDHCLKGPSSEKTAQTYRIGDNKLVGNVFVWIKPAPGTFFEVDAKQREEAKNNPVVLRQPHCAFIPHCAVLFSQYHPDPKKPKTEEPTDQVLQIVNDAPISHNTNWKGGPKNDGSNVILAAGDKRVVDNLVPDTKEVTVRCNIHTWMDAYVWVLDTPYYAISLSDTLDKNKVKKDDAAFGTYEIKNLPIGPVKVYAWHESENHWLNTGKGGGEVIEIKADGPTEKDFVLK